MTKWMTDDDFKVVTNLQTRRDQLDEIFNKIKNAETKEIAKKLKSDYSLAEHLYAEAANDFRKMIN